MMGGPPEQLAGPDPLSAAVRRLCSTTISRLIDRGLRTQVRAIHAQLAQPLCVAVAGAVSGGKSTLVNALLGRPVAPVDAGECTQVVTWYEYGLDDGRVEVESRAGTVCRTTLDRDGRLPRDLGLPTDQIERVRVQLACPALRDLSIVDTPGVNTITTANEAAARRMVLGTGDSDHAQALIYVLRYVQQFDAQTLAQFRNLSAACGMTGVNTLAVLSHIDRRGEEEDPWPAARRLAARAYEQLRASVFEVVPVIGVLAETARGGLLGPPDLAGLRTLAALDDLDLEDLLIDLPEFATSTAEEYPVPVGIRRHLIARLHRYGILVAIETLRRRPDTDLSALHRALERASGFGAVASTTGGPGATGGASFWRA
ncbi:MAG: dynamin family protein [Micromonosporaceae bacterium]|nr:dynamin family protein [Micromonosporaceae bacterium]